MAARLLSFVLFVAAVVLGFQLRNPIDPDPSGRSTFLIGLFLFGCVGIAAVLGGSAFRRRGAAGDGAVVVPENQRATYRIVYPPEGARPRLFLETLGEVGGPTRTFDVVDVSEEGVRFVGDTAAVLGDEVEGTLLFPSGKRAAVTGRVVRRQGEQVCLHLRQVVDPAIIIDEQLRLRACRKEAG